MIDLIPLMDGFGFVSSSVYTMVAEFVSALSALLLDESPPSERPSDNPLGSRGAS